MLLTSFEVMAANDCAYAYAYEGCAEYELFHWVVYLIDVLTVSQRIYTFLLYKISLIIIVIKK